jgi:WhiB family transcriptional regulator, redox-sensing transcriptional regulator
MRWQELAACAGMDVNLFFPQENIGGPHEGRGVRGERERMNKARAVCALCPVRRDCLMDAIEHDDWGIWGGMDTIERRKYARDHDLI